MVGIGIGSNKYFDLYSAEIRKNDSLQIKINNLETENKKLKKS